MWIVAAAFLWALLGSGPAAAFDCANATLPSSLILCSDPELIGLADERQEAINEARGRIGEERGPRCGRIKKPGFGPMPPLAGCRRITRRPSRPRHRSKRASSGPPSRASPTSGHMALLPGAHRRRRPKGLQAVIASAPALTAAKMHHTRCPFCFAPMPTCLGSIYASAKRIGRFTSSSARQDSPS